MKPEAGAKNDKTTLVLTVLFGAIALLNLLQQNWVYGGVWGLLALAMVLMNDADLSQPGAWKRPRYLLGSTLTVIAIVLMVARLMIDIAT